MWRAGSRARGLCSLRHASSLVEARKLSSCGVQAWLPHSMWNLSSLTRDQTRVPCIVRRILYHWTTREVPYIVFLIQFNFTIRLYCRSLNFYILFCLHQADGMCCSICLKHTFHAHILFSLAYPILIPIYFTLQKTPCNSPKG